MKEASSEIRTHDLALSERGALPNACWQAGVEGAGLVPMAKHMKSSNLPPSLGYEAQWQSG